jgi:putative DNA-invertase from lambdoid prophage Rac
MKRVALYARVSTNNGMQDPEMQLSELREYAARRDLIITAEHVDRVSGSKESRPSLNRLMQEARSRKFDTVLVWKIDRWGRSLKHLVTSLADLESYGIAFVSLLIADQVRKVRVNVLALRFFDEFNQTS